MKSYNQSLFFFFSKEVLFWLVHILRLLGLSTELHKNCCTDFHETWKDDGSGPSLDPESRLRDGSKTFVSHKSGEFTLQLSCYRWFKIGSDARLLCYSTLGPWRSTIISAILVFNWIGSQICLGRLRRFAKCIILKGFSKLFVVIKLIIIDVFFRYTFSHWYSLCCKC